MSECETFGIKEEGTEVTVTSDYDLAEKLASKFAAVRLAAALSMAGLGVARAVR